MVSKAIVTSMLRFVPDALLLTLTPFTSTVITLWDMLGGSARPLPQRYSLATHPHRHLTSPLGFQGFRRFLSTISCFQGIHVVVLLPGFSSLIDMVASSHVIRDVHDW